MKLMEEVTVSQKHSQEMWLHVCNVLYMGKQKHTYLDFMRIKCAAPIKKIKRSKMHDIYQRNTMYFIIINFDICVELKKPVHKLLKSNMEYVIF